MYFKILTALLTCVFVIQSSLPKCAARLDLLIAKSHVSKHNNSVYGSIFILRFKPCPIRSTLEYGTTSYSVVHDGPENHRVSGTYLFQGRDDGRLLPSAWWTEYSDVNCSGGQEVPQPVCSLWPDEENIFHVTEPAEVLMGRRVKAIYSKTSMKKSAMPGYSGGPIVTLLICL